MLILTRRIGESIRIGTDIEVAVVGINRSQVRVGIRAPDSINIVREELTRPRFESHSARSHDTHRAKRS